MPVDIPLSIEQLDYLLKIFGSKTQSENLTKLGIGSDGDALYVYSKSMIKSNVNNFMSEFKKYFPTFEQYFAVKALPNIHILKLLYDVGLGFDCSSISELEIINQLEKIYNIKCKKIFSSNYTTFEDIAYYFTDGVTEPSNSILNLDDIDGLNNMINFFDYLKLSNIKTHDKLFPRLLCFRLNPCVGMTSSGVESNILAGTGSKFGICTEQIISAYEVAKKYGIKEFGIHVMTGSCILDLEYFSLLVDTVYETINELFIKLDIRVKFINFGGGIGIPYRENVSPINLDLLVKNIYQGVNNNIAKYSLDWVPDVMMENGRYITGPFGWLITRCGSIKTGYNNGIFIGLRACMSNLMRVGMYGAYHHITIPRLEAEENKQKTNVVGTLCENNDWFAKDRNLPKGIQIGDIIVIHDCGAHSHSMGFQYNAKLRCGEVLFSDEGFQLIRRAETYDDYISCVVANCKL
jgi:diaminopimelate decarboxylase